MDVSLQLTSVDDAHRLTNLWPLYVHDLGPFGDTRPNAHGVFHDDDAVTTLAEQAATLGGFWQHPGRLFPYLVLADGLPAGFAIVALAGLEVLPAALDAEVEVVMHEFFVVAGQRGTGLAETAALACFAAHPGRWEVVTQPGNDRAIRFWRRVMGRAPGGALAEREDRAHAWGHRVVFTKRMEGPA